MLTQEQILSQEKTVTRRLNWQFLKSGHLLQPVVKCRGLKSGEHQRKLGAPIRVLSVRREYLDRLTADLDYGLAEVQREGFARVPAVHGSPVAFVEFFCNSHRPCEPHAWVTRIEFEYVEPT